MTPLVLPLVNPEAEGSDLKKRSVIYENSQPLVKHKSISNRRWCSWWRKMFGPPKVNPAAGSCNLERWVVTYQNFALKTLFKIYFHQKMVFLVRKNFWNTNRQSSRWRLQPREMGLLNTKIQLWKQSSKSISNRRCCSWWSRMFAKVNPEDGSCDLNKWVVTYHELSIRQTNKAPGGLFCNYFMLYAAFITAN